MINFKVLGSIKPFLEERKRKKGGQTRTRREGEKKEGGKSMGLSFIWRQASARKFISNLFSCLFFAHLHSGQKGL